MPSRSRRRLHLLVLAAVLVLTACSSSSTPPPAATPSPPGAQAVATALAAAEALFFANHYDDAQRGYAELVAIAPGSASAHAAYALFLNYRMDFPAALTEARAGVSAAAGDGRVRAVLTRVQDWSMHIDDAVASGARAIAVAAADPLTHLFYSEALADHGETAAAQAQIDAASAALGAHSTDYERAELQRERANLARDSGDTAGELSADLAAHDLQPGWIERSSELAGADIDNNQLPGAHQVLQAALALAPDDARLLATLGSVAIQQPDYATADQVYTRLLRISPRDPTVLEFAALVAMAVHRELEGGAARLLLRAIAADPTDVAAADFILHLARSVDGDEAAAREQILDTVATVEGADGSRPRPVTVPDPTAQLHAHGLLALAEVNRARLAAGVAPVTLDAGLSQSADFHCFYWLANNALPQVADLGIHQETPGQPGFTGVRAGDRAYAAGFRGGAIYEDITHRGGATAAVSDWVDSIYHRFPIIRPELRTIGSADRSIGPLPMEDMEFGMGPPPARTSPPVLDPPRPARGADHLPRQRAPLPAPQGSSAQRRVPGDRHLPRGARRCGWSASASATPPAPRCPRTRSRRPRTTRTPPACCRARR